MADGYATHFAESDEGIHCVAAPIFDRNKVAVGTLWISAPDKRMPNSLIRELSEQVGAATRRVSRLIGELG